MQKLLNTTARYGWLSMALQWLMLLLLVAVVTCIGLSDSFPNGSDTRASLYVWHFLLGLTVFTLVWSQLVANLVSPPPQFAPPIAHWQDMTAKAVLTLLYLLMIAMLLLG